MKPKYLELYKEIILEISKEDHFRLILADYYDLDVLPNPYEKSTVELNDQEFFNRLSFKHLSIGDRLLESLQKVTGLTFLPTNKSIREIFDLTNEEIEELNQEHAVKNSMATADSATYEYHPHSQVKIWLSSTPTQFMTERNQTRLLETRKQNPNLELHLVYDSLLLNDREKLRVRDFCYQHKFLPVDIRQVIKNPDKFQLTENERKLLRLYEEEINNLSNGGNLAAASDILRWISPVYSLGTYCDLDASIDTSSLPETVSVSSPLLLNVGHELKYCDNAVIAIIDQDAAKKDITRIQQILIDRCACQNNNSFMVLDFYYPWKSAVDLRQKIIDSTKDNESFVLTILNADTTVVENLFGTTASSIKDYSEAELTKMRLDFREEAIFTAIMSTTGPRALSDFLIEKTGRNISALDSYADQVGFCGYKLLEKSYEYHPDESDLSWIEQAQKEIKQENAARTIQHNYRVFKARITDLTTENDSTIVRSSNNSPT